MPDADSTCWTSIEHAAAGDEQARAWFATTYAPVVRSALEGRWRSRTMRAHIDDAVQDVFFELFRESGALARSDRSRPEGFRAFLYGITRNVARRHEQRLSAHRPESPMGDQHAAETRLSVSFDRAWARALLRMAVQRMNEQAQTDDAHAMRRVQLLRARFRDGMPIRDIAAQWGEPAESVHRWYARAREEFRSALGDVLREHAAADDATDETRIRDIMALLDD